MVTIPSPISYETLSAALSKLPEPVEAYLALSEGFDYSSISDQVNRVVSGIEVYVCDYVSVQKGLQRIITPPDQLIFRMQNPSNEKILAVYKNEEDRRREIPSIGSEFVKVASGQISRGETRPPSVEFYKGVWQLHLGELLCMLEITHFGSNLSYISRSPQEVEDFAAQLPSELSLNITPRTY